MYKKVMKYNKAFKKDYNLIFKEDPIAANMMLLFMEIANKEGQVILEGDEQKQAKQISKLMNARFNDPREYQL